MRAGVGRTVAGIAAGGLVGGLLWLPAGLLSSALPSSGSCERWSGSVWSGRCASLILDGRSIGQVSWRVRGRTLLTGTLGGDLLWQRGESWLATRIQWDPDGRMRLAPLSGHLELATLRAILGPREVTLGGNVRLDGRLEIQLDRLTWSLPERALTEVSGTLHARDLRVLGRPETWGELEVRWPDAQAGVEPFTARVIPLGGGGRLRGELQFPQGRGYRFTGKASTLGTPRTDAPLPDVSLEYWGRW